MSNLHIKLTIDVQEELLKKRDDVDENQRILHNIDCVLCFKLNMLLINFTICQWAPLLRPIHDGLSIQTWIII